MGSRIGDTLPRKFVLTVYFHASAGVALVSAITAWRGVHGWGVPLVFGVLSLAFFMLPNVMPRQREFVQIDDGGVAVETKTGIERVTWADLTKVRIVTTNEGPWVEDVYFLLEAPDGHRCAVPHGAAIRTKLLEALQSRLQGVRDDKVIEAMGCTGNNTFTVWEKPGQAPSNTSLEQKREG